MFLNFMSADFAKKLDIKVKICIMVVCATVAHTTLFLEKSMPKIMKILNNIFGRLFNVSNIENEW